MEMRIFFLSLGSNIGDKYRHITQSILLLEKKVGKIQAISSLYETKALGFESEELFFNCCVKIQTSLAPKELLLTIQSIEKKLGRIKTKQNEYESRIIDIDILLCQNQILKTKELTVPHPRFRERNFVLYPLEEIAKNEIDPVNSLTIYQLKKNSPDFSEIKRLNLNISLKK